MVLNDLQSSRLQFYKKISIFIFALWSNPLPDRLRHGNLYCPTIGWQQAGTLSKKDSLPRLNGGRLKRRAAPRMASAALAADRPRARAGAGGAAGRVNRCQHSTPDRVSRLTPPVSRHDRPKSERVKQHSRAQKHSMCPMDKTGMFLQCTTQEHKMLPIFQFGRKQMTQNVANISHLSEEDSSI
jgi:hypothetical protein